jgi:predicted HTH domain antitoxin
VATNKAQSGQNEAKTTMQVLSIPYSDDLLVSTGKSKEALEQELRFLLAVKLFELRRVSLGKAAQLCGMPKLNFMDEIGRMGVPVINLDDDQIQDELNNA